MKIKKIIVISVVIIIGVFFLFSGYSYWNMADPDKTCASCHEISHSVASFKTSAHGNLSCYECHGTALSNGLHSLKEKSNMLFTHIKEDVSHNDIRMTEEQVMKISNECARCHQSEFANWQAGGHSATYTDIFLDPVHNKMEPPYADCFRCHGMFYEGTIEDLVEPISRTGPWNLKDPSKAHHPTIPCLSCHQVHTDNEPLSKAAMDSLGYLNRNPIVSLYIRADDMHMRSDKLVHSRMFHNGEEIKTSEDYTQRVCLQCHAPNFAHEAGSEDDRTPTGVHEGLSCNSCHLPHSNDARNSCTKCHPGISNCNIDVRTMNTTFADKNSPNNIHSVSCNDCHSENELSAFHTTDRAFN